MKRICALFMVALSCVAGYSEQTFTAPSSIPRKLIDRINASHDAFVPALEALIASDHDNLLSLVDKTHPLSALFIPSDLVVLASGRSYVVGKSGLSLRRPVEAGLDAMATAAQKDGVTLLVSSSYRSYDYQKQVYARNVKQMGQTEADRVSARPGMSQHQTGCAIDFGSITDDYAKTKAGMWLAQNAEKYGWSLSFPEGYEKITGYRWECWHYRFIGVDAAAFQKEWFGDVQQYMMEFIDAWKKSK